MVAIGSGSPASPVEKQVGSPPRIEMMFTANSFQARGQTRFVISNFSIASRWTINLEMSKATLLHGSAHD
jgi:hypothetical protein